MHRVYGASGGQSGCLLVMITKTSHFGRRYLLWWGQQAGVVTADGKKRNCSSSLMVCLWWCCAELCSCSNKCVATVLQYPWPMQPPDMLCLNIKIHVLFPGIQAATNDNFHEELVNRVTKSKTQRLVHSFTMISFKETTANTYIQ